MTCEPETARPARTDAGGEFSVLRNRSIRAMQALFVAVGLWSCSADPAPPVGAVDSEDPVAGVLDGREIRLSALDEWIRKDLFDRRAGGSDSKLYELRASSIERMIDQQLLQAAVADSGLSESEFMQGQIEAIAPITDEAIASFYEQNKDGLSQRGDLETLSPKIREFLEQQQPQGLSAHVARGPHDADS